MADRLAGDERFVREVLFDLEKLGDDAARVLRDVSARAELFDLDDLAQLRKLKNALRELAAGARQRAFGSPKKEAHRG